MRSRRIVRPIAAIALALLAAGALFVILRRAPAPEPDNQRNAVTESQAPATAASAPTTARADAVASPTPTAASNSSALLEREWDRLVADGTAAAAKGPDAARAFILELFAALDGLMPDERLAVIFAFFESGRDVRLGRAFTIGPGGFLRDWPTLRVALLDYLAQRDGPAARILAEQLLRQRPEEPGEWTLALRELTRGQAAGSWPALVTDRMRTFVLDPGWSAQASASWLEGFDVIVAGRSPAFLADLSAIAARAGADARSAQFAAFLAADRMVMASPAEMLSTLNRDRTLFASQPNVRAGLFARADIRRAAQTSELETYLTRSDITAAERESFAGLFPLYDLAVSTNLLTPAGSRSMADMIAHDRAAVASIDRWLGRPEFEPWHRPLRETRARLVEQLAQTGP